MSETIETPCRSLCAVDGMSGFCRGCGRSLREIAGWRDFSAAKRRTIMAALPERMQSAGFIPRRKARVQL